MLDAVMGLMHASSLHWTVLGGAVVAFVVKVFVSTEDLLMGDLYGDELED